MVAHVPIIRLNNITQFSPLLNCWWTSLICGSQKFGNKQGFLSVCGMFVSWEQYGASFPGGLGDRAETGGCHMVHWYAPAMRTEWIALIGIIRKIMESDWLQRTWHFASKLWGGKGRTVKKKGIHINWHVIQLPQVTLIWEEKTFQHFLELNTKYLCFIMCRQGNFQCVHIPNAYVLCISTNTWRCN